MKLSVVIPVLNERTALPVTISTLCQNASPDEIIVVDGGSTDGTVEWLRAQPNINVQSAKLGRGMQLHAGAHMAANDLLLFLHADSIIHPALRGLMADALSNNDVAGGASTVRFPEPCTLGLRITATAINARSILLHDATGDQGIFVRRSVYEASGGFRTWPLFEDFDLVKRIKQLGEFVILRSPATLSPRRWTTRGVARTNMLMLNLYIGYKLGISPDVLKHRYLDVR